MPAGAGRSSLSRSPQGDGEGAIGRARLPGGPRAGGSWRPGVVVLWLVLIGSFQRQRVDLPSGVRYWSVVDERFELVAMFDGFLFEERVSRDRSEMTTGQYASNLVEFATWAHDRGLLVDLVACARNLGMFQLHLRTTPIARRGRGHGRARSNDRVSDMMSSVRGFYRHQVRRGVVSSSVNQLLYDVVEPAGGSMPWLEDLPPIVARPLHRLPRSGLSEPRTASLEEYVAMLACRRERARQAVDHGPRADRAADRSGAGSAPQRHALDGQLARGRLFVSGPACPRGAARGQREPGAEQAPARAGRAGSSVGGWRLRRVLRRARPGAGGVLVGFRVRQPAVAVSSAGRCATVARERSWRCSGVGPGSSGSVTPASVSSRARDRDGRVGPLAGRGSDDSRPRSGRDDSSLHAHLARARCVRRSRAWRCQARCPRDRHERAARGRGRARRSSPTVSSLPG